MRGKSSSFIRISFPVKLLSKYSKHVAFFSFSQWLANIWAVKTCSKIEQNKQRMIGLRVFLVLTILTLISSQRIIGKILPTIEPSGLKTQSNTTRIVYPSEDTNKNRRPTHVSRSSSGTIAYLQLTFSCWAMKW